MSGLSARESHPELTSPAHMDCNIDAHVAAFFTVLTKRLLVVKDVGVGRSRTCAKRSYCFIVPAN